MKNAYIQNKDFYIREDLGSMLLYFDHFSQGISALNGITNSTLLRKISTQALRVCIVLLFFTKLYRMIYKTTELTDDALIIIKRKGKWPNTLRLIKDGNRLKILKQTHNNDYYQREKKFYELYRKNATKLRLPTYTFLDNNLIEMEFLPVKTWQRLINEGSISFAQSLDHFYKIKKELQKLYKNNKALIHGDLWLTNIFLVDNAYYVIDYTDSHRESVEYDLYVLVMSLLSSFKNFGTNWKDKDFYKIKREFTSKLLLVPIKEVEVLEKRYKTFRTQKLLQ